MKFDDGVHHTLVSYLSVIFCRQKILNFSFNFSFNVNIHVERKTMLATIFCTGICPSTICRVCLFLSVRTSPECLQVLSDTAFNLFCLFDVYYQGSCVYGFILYSWLSVAFRAFYSRMPRLHLHTYSLVTALQKK